MFFYSRNLECDKNLLSSAAAFSATVPVCCFVVYLAVHSFERAHVKPNRAGRKMHVIDVATNMMMQGMGLENVCFMCVCVCFLRQA